jgi:hypothetical protein
VKEREIKGRKTANAEREYSKRQVGGGGSASAAVDVLVVLLVTVHDRVRSARGL